MATFNLIILFLLLSTFQPTDNSFDFKEDIERDKRILKVENYTGNAQLRQFERFKSIDLSEFKFSFQKERTTSLKKWKRNTGSLREFYQIDCKISVDTVVSFTDVDTKAILNRVSVKATFSFRTYIFKLVNKPRDWYYMTNLRDGLVETSVDGIESNIAPETIAVGSDIACWKAKAETDKMLKNR
ncbi:hypothetical protein [Pedobacter sp. SYSU D00535]|uniref:hypothetical protein n=1 Tax=Pedobacter sp. SYSU D00535 TaxID=2810308 RepID=UPI001A95A090|nr:hypothetical protein [Pedobacter sp. SYSU D00535]